MSVLNAHMCTPLSEQQLARSACRYITKLNEQIETNKALQGKTLLQVLPRVCVIAFASPCCMLADHVITETPHILNTLVECIRYFRSMLS